MMTAQRTARTLAASAGFTFAALGVPHYEPIAPEFASMGDFSLYMRGACDEALTKQPHCDASYSRYGDPLSVLVSGLVEAEVDGESLLVGLKAISLSALIIDILDASQRDPDQMRRLQFGCAVHDHVARALIRLGGELGRSGNVPAGIKAIHHADDQLDRAQIFVDAMHKLNEEPQQQAAE